MYQAEPIPCVPLLPVLPKNVCVTSLSMVLGPQPVGGIAELPEVTGTSLAATDSSSPHAGLLAGIAASTALSLGGAGWYARKRWPRQ